VFQTREIVYDYKIRIEWGRERQRARRLRLALAMIAPVAVALLGGMASHKLSKHEFHLPPWDRLVDRERPTAEKILPIPVASERMSAYRAVLAELQPVNDPFAPRHLIAPAPAFPGLTGAPATAQGRQYGHDEGAATGADEEFADTDGWQTVTVNQGDNLSLIFERLGLSGNDLDRILGLGGDTATLKTLRPRDSLHFRISDGALAEMVHEIDVARTLYVRNNDGAFSAETVKEDLHSRVVHTSGAITSSLFEAGLEAGLSDAAIMDLAEIFGFDIDLVLDIREGDRFTVVYEEIFKDGKKVKDGNILAAEFVNQGTAYRAVRYAGKDGGAEYYRPDGQSLRRAFIRTPLAFSRISSKFSLARKHPVLNRIRAHKGVDYAAPTGTPVKATGNAKVKYAGWQGGYGRVVILDHPGGYTTVYGHLSRFAGGVRAGRTVRIGETIGYVGKSGLATGPHLHYEFRVNGEHRDPLTVKLPKAVPIAPGRLADFRAKTQQAVAMLEQASTFAVAKDNTAPANTPTDAPAAVVASARR
jgi:murein DD-endopeptidase MepM/ murein hydrolase activator NlpD